MVFIKTNGQISEPAMQLDLPEQLHTLAQAAPFPLYAVGGAVRDCLAGLPATPDIDLCAPASAEAFSALAQKCGMRVLAVYKNTGTVNLEAGGCKIEFTSFRTDLYRGGEHAPVRVTFTDDIEQDAKRRDFRCNAVYYDIARGEIADPLGGAKDAAGHVLQTTRDADEVFAEDGLRLMRLARLSAQLGFTPTLECIFGAKFNAARIVRIAPERIFAELRQLLYADQKYGRQYAHYEGLKLLEGTDVLPYILPELAAGKGLAQRADFHDHDVLEHSFRACKYADPRVRFAALLHDAGKPAVFAETGKYHGHDAAGAPIARAALERLKAPKKLCEEVERLTLLHMYDLDMKTRESKIRAFIVKNFDVYEPLLLLKIQSPKITVVLLRNTGCLKYIVLQFLLRTACIHNEERNKKHPLILALQFFQKRFCILPVGGEIRRNDIHIISGTDRLFLFLDL